MMALWMNHLADMKVQRRRRKETVSDNRGVQLGLIIGGIVLAGIVIVIIVSKKNG